MPVRWLGGLLACLALCCAATAWAEVPVPALKARVTDLTQTLSATQSKALESDLQALEERSGSQVAVLLVPSTQPESIEQFSMRVVEQWKLGRKGKDDGVLLLVAKNDRKVRIEVGYGLEGTISDAVARRVIDEAITPLFKQRDFAGGIAAGVQRLADLIEGHPKAAREDMTAPETATQATRQLALQHPLGSVTDLTGTLSFEQTWAWGKELSEFYDSGRAKAAHVVVVPTVKPGTMDGYAADILKTWRERDNLNTDRTILLLVAKDDRSAYVASGADLGERILPGAREKLVTEVIEPKLNMGDLTGAVESGIHGIEQIIDDAIDNKTTGERVKEHLGSLPIWLIVVVVVFGTGLRWLLGPLFGALASGAAVGAGAWFVSGEDMTTTLQAAFVTFIIVLVGIENWITAAFSGGFGGGGGGSSGGFGGGGGGFGGGGASGSW